MVAAGYTMCVFRLIALSGCLFFSSVYVFRYGSSANLVLSTGNGVNGYTLDAALGEFILTHPDVRPFPSFTHLIIITAFFSFLKLEKIDQDPNPRQDLLLQRRQLDVLPPTSRQLSEQHQVPDERQVPV